MAKGDLFMKHKLTAQELGSFCRQLGILIHSGMGPLESLHILLEESEADTDHEILSDFTVFHGKNRVLISGCHRFRIFSEFHGCLYKNRRTNRLS